MCVVHVIRRFNLQIDSIDSFFNGSNSTFFCRLHKTLQWNSRNCDFSSIHSFILSFAFCYECQYIHLEPGIHRRWIEIITYTLHMRRCCVFPSILWIFNSRNHFSFIPFEFEFEFNLIFDAFTHITSLLKTAARKIGEKNNTNSSN